MTPLPLPNDQPGAQPQRAGRREWIGVAALALPCMLVVMDLSVLFLAVPSLSADLHPTPTQLLWITDVYGFLIAGALIAMGALGDRIGRRKVLVWGSAAFGAASVLAALSTSPEMLIAARGLQGIAGATLIPSTMSLLFAMFPHEEDRMKALGLISAGFTSGAALGPILGGVLLDVSTWHAVFLINVPAMLAVLWFVPRYVPEFANPAAPRVDLPSAGMLMLAVLPATYGIKRFARGTGGAADAALIAFGVAVLVVLLARQRRIANPLINLSLFRIRRFSAPLAGMCVTTFVMFGTFFFVAQYFQIVLNLDPLPAALWGLPGIVTMTLGTMVVVPKLATRYRPGPLMASGAALMAVGLAALSMVDADTPPALVALVVAVFQFGVAPLVTLGNNLILGAAPPEATGQASGTSQTLNELGGALGIAVLGSIGTAHLPADLRDATDAAFTHGMSVVALLGAALMLGVAALLTFAFRERAADEAAAPGEVQERVAEPVAA
ncbi:MFS transporter [Conexibacter woesei]|uniref:MFS transporter n=1 Tax=Conexibacter woesei TaxID=191495 RepID=UPI000417C1D0|nr:MFS transporter [Conexibacter woesei]